MCRLDEIRRCGLEIGGLPGAGPLGKDAHKLHRSRVLAALCCHGSLVDGVALKRAGERSRHCAAFGNFGKVVEAHLDLTLCHHLAARPEPRDLQLWLDLLGDAELVDGGCGDCAGRVDELRVAMGERASGKDRGLELVGRRNIRPWRAVLDHDPDADASEWPTAIWCKIAGLVVALHCRR